MHRALVGRMLTRGRGQDQLAHRMIISIRRASAESGSQSVQPDESDERYEPELISYAELSKISGIPVNVLLRNHADAKYEPETRRRGTMIFAWRSKLPPVPQDMARRAWERKRR